MPLVSSTIPNLINGVSQQPAALRLASQAQQVVNCMPSPVEGLKKRPPFNHVKKLFSGSAGSTRPFVHIVDRDGAIRFLVIITNGGIRVFDVDGTEKTVATPDGTNYLQCSGEPSAQIRVASVADATFILNREKVTSMLTGGGDLSPGVGTDALVYVRAADYDTKYSVKVGATSVDTSTNPAGGLDIAATYNQAGSTTVTVTANGHGLSTGNVVTVGIVTGTAASGRYTITVTGANTFTYQAANSITTNGNCEVNYDPPLSTVEIATQLETKLVAALTGYTITRKDYVVRIKKNDGADYDLVVGDSRNSVAIVGVKGSVAGITDLPLIGFNNQVVRVQGSINSAFDDYYVKFVGKDPNVTTLQDGQWKETVAPGIAYQFNATTMPHVLVRESNGTFTFKKFTWSPRVAGDATSAPNPSFVGTKVNNLTLFRNRLAFLADENVILSATDSYDRFFPETVQTVIDSDPIDLSCGGNRVNILLAAVSFGGTLLLFSRHGQFRLDSGSALSTTLTTKTANITQLTAFEMVTDVDPVAVGRVIYFPIPRGEFSGLREFFLSEGTNPLPESEEVSAAIPRLIPRELVTMIGAVAEESIVLIGKSQPKRLYLYKFFYNEQEKLQSAWSYWEVSGSKTILGADFLDSDLYAVIQYADGVYLEKAVIRPENSDPGSSVELLVDRKADETQCTTVLDTGAGLGLQSTITLPYPINAGSQMVVVGRYAAGNTIQLGQVITPISSSGSTITVRGDLTQADFYVGELYQMLYEFSTQYLKEQPSGGGVSVISGPRLQLRTWTMIFDNSSSFNVRITPKGRDPYTYPYSGMELGDATVPLGSPGINTGRFRVPVMTQNIHAKIEIVSDAPLPCRLQSAEWEGWYHSRTQRL